MMIQLPKNVYASTVKVLFCGFINTCTNYFSIPLTYMEYMQIKKLNIETILFIKVRKKYHCK